VCSWRALERDPALAAPFAHVVALDPPLGAGADAPTAALDPLAAAAAALAGAHGATVHLAWGEEEGRFALAVLEATCALRAPAAALYRALRDGRALGDALAAAGPPAVAGRALRVLTEIGVVALDRAALAVGLPPAQRTDLERSAAFRAAAARLAAGRAQIGGRETAAAAA
jgi:single-stranded-DNA-specific exonuclease